MNDKFDKILTKKIEESFRELHVPYEAEHWNNLRSRIKSSGNNSTKFWIKALKIAAVFLFGAALSLYYFSTLENDPQLSLTEEIPPAKEQITPGLSSDELQNAPTDSHNDVAVPNGSSTKEDNIKEYNHKRSNELATPPLSEEFVINQSPSISFYDNSILSVFVNEDSSAITTAKLQQNNSRVKSPATVRKSDFKTQKPKVSILANTNFGFSKAEEGTPFGFATGVSSVFSLSKKMSISSGLVVAYHNLNIKETGNELTLESTVGEVQEITRANLLSLDIPVNVRYHFKESDRTRSFLSIGFSSLLYLQQKFTTTNRQLIEEVTESEDGSIIITKNVSEQLTTSSRPAFSKFDAAGLLNVSFGFQRPLSYQSDIVIEPFLKYPLGTLTTQNAKFGYGGVQIQIVF